MTEQMKSSGILNPIFVETPKDEAKYKLNDIIIFNENIGAKIIGIDDSFSEEVYYYDIEYYMGGNECLSKSYNVLESDLKPQHQTIEMTVDEWTARFKPIKNMFEDDAPFEGCMFARRFH